jgi:hypothetical protein
MRKPGKIPVLLVALSFTAAAFPCGDKLSAMGGGVRFERIHAARHPGRVVIFAPNDSPLQAANVQLRLADVLRRAGHSVEVVDEQQRLQRALQLAAADLILIDVSDAGRFNTFESAGKPAAVLSVSYAGNNAKTTPSAASKCVTRLTKRSNPLLLRSIDDLLELRMQGKPAACETRSLPRSA